MDVRLDGRYHRCLQPRAIRSLGSWCRNLEEQNEAVKTIRVYLHGLPLFMRWAVVGAVVAGVTGSIVGLVIGLWVYAPTAPFAAIELGLPATIIGGIFGLAGGAIVAAVWASGDSHP